MLVGIPAYNVKTQQKIFAVRLIEVPMFTMLERGHPLRRTIAASLLAAGCALAAPPSPAVAQNAPTGPYPYQNQSPPSYQVPPYQTAPPAASNSPAASYPGEPPAGQPSAAQYSAPSPQYPYYS